ncbi:unnamed protein product [Adineta ricciae]|uniref:Uncharacterized protein n=1 Tax=Adineta ricciae TaxID=249248 RepID=A0A815EAZ8_ADIRI|nr:unnamed protein product [Adineta ricciae]
MLNISYNQLEIEKYNISHILHLTTQSINNQIGPFGVKYLADLIRKNKLTTLDCLNNSMSDTSVQHLTDTFQIGGFGAQYIDNQIGDLGAPQSLADALQHSSKLNQLTLRFNEIGDPGARSIAALLQKKRNTNSSGPTIE